MKNLLYTFCLLFILVGCKDDDIDPSVSFTKIYDSFRSDQSYYPIDMVATDSGFLVLTRQSLSSTTDNKKPAGVQLIELDEEGNYSASSELNTDEYESPVGDFVTIDDMHYFVMMDNNKRAQLCKVGNSASSLEIIALNNGLSWPLAVNVTADSLNLILLSFDGVDQMVLSIHDKDGNVIRDDNNNDKIRTFSIGTNIDISSAIFDHFSDPERYGLPFFCGQMDPSTYYFNGIFNHTLSVVFTVFGDAETGVVQGQSTDGGLTAALPISGSTFSIFGYQYNDNFIQPIQNLETNSITSSIDFMTVPFSEYRSRTPADIVLYEYNDVQYSVIAAETQSRQIAINVFDATTGESTGVLKIGNINPYTLASIKVDEENNLIVLGTTLVSGRFPRMFVKKISEKEMGSLVK
ncbi:hypothetical protein N6H18_10790 [Reichenbachiella agarivorans]|uniref:DUF4374 domain-containing protein n=1 Tax=Reichenbachiella agarivorans TaxID=2979464 RepID=A0ABY6CM79_9BACT|nr:hypothetical protein [Reichenbachiella agarivorans]UXP30839.1 hypothetical protein N6H18_10790 [Reichenbachiella agarivorans]